MHHLRPDALTVSREFRRQYHDGVIRIPELVVGAILIPRQCLSPSLSVSAAHKTRWCLSVTRLTLRLVDTPGWWVAIHLPKIADKELTDWLRRKRRV